MLLISRICLKETTGSLEVSRKWAFSPLGNKDTLDITASHTQHKSVTVKNNLFCKIIHKQKGVNC